MKKFLLLLLGAFLLQACAPEKKTTISPTATPFILAGTPTTAALECTSFTSLPTPSPEEESLFPAVGEGERILGGADAVVTFVEYCDYQGPGCARLAPVLADLVAQFPEGVRVVYRDFPLVNNPGHERSALAAQAVHAARAQGVDWELHELLFAEREAWGELTEDEFVRWVAGQASTLGVDGAQLAADMQSDALVEQMQQSFLGAQEIGIPGTPFLLINGQIYSGPLDFDSLERITQLILLGERQFTSCPPQVINATKEYLAHLETEKGEIVIQFYPQQAPVAVNNFVFLAREGWYDGITFHRVISGYVAQTGDPSGTGQGNPGYFFKNEIDDALIFDRPGVVAMANVGGDTNGSQFFITYAAAPALDGKYTIFGQVLSGMDVLEQLTPRDAQLGETLPAGDLILRIWIEER